MEFAREKGTLFHKWYSSCKALDYKSPRETILLEEFKRCLPDRVVVYLNEQKGFTISCAATLADEYVLTHRITFGLQSISTSAPHLRGFLWGVVFVAWAAGLRGGEQPLCPEAVLLLQPSLPPPLYFLLSPIPHQHTTHHASNP